ncbi:MAG: secretin N-terminal domain-containing protein [Planctomycetota bacterium]
MVISGVPGGDETCAAGVSSHEGAMMSTRELVNLSTFTLRKWLIARAEEFIRHCCYVLIAIALCNAPPHLHAQNVADDASSATVRLSFPPNVELRLLVDYVSERMGINILYGDEVGRARVTLKAPVDIPVEALPGVLESALRMNGLTLVDADQPGWKRIVNVQGMAAVAGRAEDDPDANAVVTQMIELKHTDPSRLESLIRPFLTPQGANLIVDTERRLLILTDFQSQVQRVVDLIERLDRPRDPPVVEFVPAKHVSGPRLAQSLNQLLSSSQRLGQRNSGGTPGNGELEVTADERTNRLILIGSPDQVAQAQKLAGELDRDLGLETRIYPMLHVSPERLDALVRRLIDPLEVDRLYISTIETEGGYLVASATPGIHQQVAELQAQLDVPLTEVASPVRFYKLQNADAAEVLATIRAIEGGAGLEGIDLGAAANAQANTNSPTNLADNPNSPPPPGIPPLALATVQGREATVTADQNLNSIIVIAEPAVQRVYESLILQLDKRRPQVMIEATIVTLDTTDGFTLGVEVSGGDFAGDFQSFTFSQFGLSEISDTGRLDLIPGLGFNGAVLSADIADIVVQALKTNGRTSVVSAPKILVNDNATGTISSVAEAPVASINQGQNSDTTSFSQFVEAGTTITVTPQIAEGNHLRLEFEVSLESFSGEGSDTLPPPRSSNSVASEITIPDGATIVVGGINRNDLSESISRIPLLGEVPVLEYLFTSRSVTESESTLFVFLRPVILRDDRFADLKFYSAGDIKKGGLPPEFPSSDPMLIP